MSLKCSTIMLSAAKVKRGCTISRYTLESFLLNNVNGAITCNGRAYALLPAGVARGGLGAEALRDRRHEKGVGQ